jgi:hypothetical protein
MAAVLLVGACGSDPARTPPADTSVAPPSSVGSFAAGSGATSSTTGVNTPVRSGSAGASATPTSSSNPSTVPNTGDVAQPAQADVLPCNVSTILAGKCQTCHSASPIAGAPMPLVTYADLQKPAVTQPTMKVYQVVQKRIRDEMRPMPPTGIMATADLTTLDGWITAGAHPGTAADAACKPAGSTGPGGALPDLPVGNTDGSTTALVEGPGEKCYEFKTHNSTTSVDDTPYAIDAGEHYEQFYFNVPWPKDSIAIAYGTRMDNPKVLHHWLLFSTNEAQTEGNHFTAPLPTLIGTDPVLLAGWAVGGPNLVAPKDVGFELPDPGRTINVQWHFYNSTGSQQMDKSSVQICTVPKTMRPNIGGVTWLGTEDLMGNVWFGGSGMPAHKETTFTTTCEPARTGMNATDPIHIIGFEPHMHRIGKHMTTSVVKADGTTSVIFDKPFSFGNETHYYESYTLMPSEKLITSCTFNNTNDYGVPFGESSDSEMCYQFAFAYPVHALSNFAASILGVTDTCWSATTSK